MVCFMYRVNSEHRRNKRTLKLRTEIEEHKLRSCKTGHNERRIHLETTVVGSGNNTMINITKPKQTVQEG